MPDVSPLQAKRLLDEGAILIDVRTSREYMQEKIPNARLIVLDQDFSENIRSQNNEKTYVIYCRSGSRSRIAMRFMEGIGFKKAYNLEGGLIKWKMAGLPVK